MSKSTTVSTFRKQRGLATLTVSMLTLFLMMMVVFSVGRSAVFEQKLTANNIRLKEVYAAAIEGSDYAAEWIKSNAPDWSGSDDANAVAGETASPTALANSAMGTDSYAHTITYTLLTDVNADPSLIQIDSTATGVGDTHVTTTVTTYVIAASFLAGDGIFNGPPLMVEECVTDVTGSPDIYPGASNMAIGTLGLNGSSTGCLDYGHFDLNGGVLGTLPGPTSMVDALFGYDDAEAIFQEWAAEFPANFIYVGAGYDSTGYYSFNGNQWHVDVGTSTDPVILWFSDEGDYDCPKLNGNTTVFGLIFYEETDCSSQGWGAGDVFGTVAQAGDVVKFTANANLTDFDVSGSFGIGNSIYTRVTVIPGTWHDF